MSVEQALSVREMRLDELGVRIDYLHDSSDEHLRVLGVDQARLPTREAWRQHYAEAYVRPTRERENYSLVWELDGEVVGFSSVDRIAFGNEAFMHLHMLNATQREEGLGTMFVRNSVASISGFSSWTDSLANRTRSTRRRMSPDSGSDGSRIARSICASSSRAPT